MKDRDKLFEWIVKCPVKWTVERDGFGYIIIKFNILEDEE